MLLRVLSNNISPPCIRLELNNLKIPLLYPANVIADYRQSEPKTVSLK